MSQIIERAGRFAKWFHASQRRKFSGVPYITHPQRVAEQVNAMDCASIDMVCAAWLHDVLEDTPCPRWFMRMHFPEQVVGMVDELTNGTKPSGVSREQRKHEDRMRLSRVSIEAKIIKFVDRIDNLAELDVTVPEQRAFARVYVPESALLAIALRDPHPRNIVIKELHGKLTALCHLLLPTSEWIHDGKPVFQ